MHDSERYWQAVCERDERWDGCFVFAVRSTGIYCRPQCPARRPTRANVEFHANAASAAAAGFRPCKRCTPDTQSPAARLDALVEAACRLLQQDASLGLAALAARIGLSPSHLARAFRERLGVSPHVWARQQRELRLQRLLPTATSVLDAALDAGYSGTPALYAQPSALSPGQRRRGASGERLRYALARCPLGLLLLAASERGVCALQFGDDQASLLEELRGRFPAAELLADDAGLGDWLQQVLQQLDEPARAANLPLDIRGSAFQMRVWQALREIPLGQTRRYGELALLLDSHPRAVARACASNPLGLLVPCHRVIGANGSLSGYRWGLARKAALLQSEQDAETASTD